MTVDFHGTTEAELIRNLSILGQWIQLYKSVNTATLSDAIEKAAAPKVSFYLGTMHMQWNDMPHWIQYRFIAIVLLTDYANFDMCHKFQTNKIPINIYCAYTICTTYIPE